MPNWKPWRRLALVVQHVRRRATSQAMFDPYNPRRLLVWGTWKGDKHVRLVEVEGDDYPSS